MFFGSLSLALLRSGSSPQTKFHVEPFVWQPRTLHCPRNSSKNPRRTHFYVSKQNKKGSLRVPYIINGS